MSLIQFIFMTELTNFALMKKSLSTKEVFRDAEKSCRQ
jgi:hypothetical protein